MRRVSVEPFVLVLLTFWMTESTVEGCMCLFSHLQTRFCETDVVFHAKVIESKTVPWITYFERVQYKIKLIKMFKGFDKVDDFQYIDTPAYDSLCGVRLNIKNKAGYLLSGRVRDDKSVEVLLCGIAIPWEKLSSAQKENLKYRYQKGCECSISRCHRDPCGSPSADECMVTSGPQTSQHVCMRNVSGSCQWSPDAPDQRENDVIQEPGTRDSRESSSGGSGDGEIVDKSVTSQLHTQELYESLRKRKNRKLLHGKEDFV